MAQGIYKITEQFEDAIADYTGAPYCVAIDNCSNALFLALTFSDIKGKEIEIPSHTYPSVPCEIIHAGGIPVFVPSKEKLKGAYRLSPTNVYDSALRFTCNMYIPYSFMCLSFTGPYKHLKLGKAGAILTDDYTAYLWFKRARFSGRREMSYHYDQLDQLGWNYYLMPEISARGVLLMNQFYDENGNPIPQEDKELPYPDLSQFDVYSCPR
jgi:dTDP-4-amino-4,6-dideoxygalactose transaminase